MTEEEMKARIAELEDEKAALKTKNSELIDREKAAKTKADEAEAAREEAAEKAERDAKDIEALEKRLNAKFQKDIDKLTGERDTANSELRTIRVDNEIARSLTDGKARPELSEALTAMLKAKVAYENGAATIDSKPIADYVSEYLGTEGGAHFRLPAQHSGANASGAATKITEGHGFTKDNFASKMGEWSVLAGKDAATAKQIAIEVGRTDLASAL